MIEVVPDQYSGRQPGASGDTGPDGSITFSLAPGDYTLAGAPGDFLDAMFISCTAAADPNPSLGRLLTLAAGDNVTCDDDIVPGSDRGIADDGENRPAPQTSAGGDPAPTRRIGSGGQRRAARWDQTAAVSRCGEGSPPR